MKLYQIYLREVYHEDSNGYGDIHKNFYDSIKEDNLEEYTAKDFYS